VERDVEVNEHIRILMEPVVKQNVVTSTGSIVEDSEFFSRLFQSLPSKAARNYGQ